MTGKSYTTSDDSICTRANIYNIWVTSVPDDARTIDGDNTNISPVLIDGETIGDISTISVTFRITSYNVCYTKLLRNI